MKIVERFETAVRQNEIIGALEPEDWPAIEKEYKESKETLLKYIQNLKDKRKPGK
jgi:hypothetical protein